MNHILLLVALVFVYILLTFDFYFFVVCFAGLAYLSRMEETITPSYIQTSEAIDKLENLIQAHESYPYAYSSGFFSGLIKGLSLTNAELRSELVKFINLEINRLENK
jgi:hypothetical protein